MIKTSNGDWQFRSYSYSIPLSRTHSILDSFFSYLNTDIKENYVMIQKILPFVQLW
jgi:hypothetical protein